MTLLKKSKVKSEGQKSRPDDESSVSSDSSIDKDMPPAYETSRGEASYAPRPPEKSPALQSFSSSGLPTPSTATSPSIGTPQGTSAGWLSRSFGSTRSRIDNEVRQTALGLIRDVVRQSYTSATVSILQGCAEACGARGLHFNSIIQEKSIEGHTPLYWAIVKRDVKGPPRGDEQSVFDLLLSFPQEDSTRSEACLACIIESDNNLFQYLQHSPGWRARGKEEILFGAIPQDIITVSHDDEFPGLGIFRANFHVPAFQKRLRVLNTVRLEFVARERMWALIFQRDPSSTASKSEREGYVRLKLMKHSPKTAFKGSITIKDVSKPSSSDNSASSPIIIPFKGTNNLDYQSEDGVKASLSKVEGSSALHYEGSPFIGADGSLDFSLEGALTKE